MEKIRVGVAGASGYTGAELLRLLICHPNAAISAITSERYAGERVSAAFPSLRGLIDLEFEELSSATIATNSDFIFLALPHKTAMDAAGRFLCAGKRVVDLSADFRLLDPELYKQWYDVEHSYPEYLSKSVYGLPEIHRKDIAQASLVANPGCYPTSVILALAPFVANELIDTSSIVADCKSGISGAGRQAALDYTFCERFQSVKPYNVAGHRHTAEMEQELGKLAGHPIKLTFTPHLVPASRGILSAAYARLKVKTSGDDLRDLLAEYYLGEPFIRILPGGVYPDTASVAGSNFCDIAVEIDKRTGYLIAMSAIDNLVKGASGQAVQNMNIMFSLDEMAGLLNAPVFP